jgi:hypothetical protein
MRRSALPWLALLLLAELAFCLACRLVPPPDDAARGPEGSSVAGRFFTATRSGLGASAIGKADLYLHRGVERVRQEAFRGTWFQRMGARVSIRGVIHREGGETREVIPWLWFGTTMDPDNMDYLLMSIFWLKMAGRDDLAMNVVREALGRHPREPRLHLERARLFLRCGMTAEAARALDTGMVCIAGDQGQDADAVNRSLFTYRALIHEYVGDTNAAVACYSGLKDQTQEFQDRLSDLRNNRPPAVPAATLLSDLVHVAHQCDDHGNHAEAGRHPRHGGNAHD